MITRLVCFTLLLIAQTASADNLAIPSDEEMLKKGRAELNKDFSAFGRAERDAGTSMPLTLPAESIRPSPLARELAKETFSYNLKKESSDKKGTELIVFVSFSMPEDELAEYSNQAKESGAVIVLRGLWQDSVMKTQQRAATVNRALAQWDINPGLFRKFKVDRVPAIILADVKQSEVVEDGCAQPGSYLRVDGAVSIRQSLLLMRQRGEGPLAGEAAQRLAKLETQR